MTEPPTTTARAKIKAQTLTDMGHFVIVALVIVVTVGLRIDRAIDVPTTSSVLIGSLGYATGLTAGRSKNGHSNDPNDT